jgi:hypothetical protein
MSWRQRLTELTLAGGILGAAAATPSCMNCGPKYECQGAAAEQCKQVAFCADANGHSTDDGGCELQDGGVVTFDDDGGVHQQ